MLEIINTLVALVALGISGVVTVRLMRLESRLGSMQALPPGNQQALPLPELPPKPLEGLRIAVAIRQDHTHPVFATLLKEQLLLEDVTEVDILNPDQAVALVKSWHDGPDILISGDLVCNGYAEIYYQADLSCRTPSETVCALMEKPAHGDRPSNLAIELVTRLKSELSVLVARSERRRAIRELRGV